MKKLLTLSIEVPSRDYAEKLTKQLVDNGLNIKSSKYFEDFIDTEASNSPSTSADTMKSSTQTNNASTASTASTTATTQSNQANPSASNQPSATASEAPPVPSEQSSGATNQPSNDVQAKLDAKFGTVEIVFEQGERMVAGKAIKLYKPSELYVANDENAKQSVKDIYDLNVKTLNSPEHAQFHEKCLSRIYWIERVYIANGVMNSYSNDLLTRI